MSSVDSRIQVIPQGLEGWLDRAVWGNSACFCMKLVGSVIRSWPDGPSQPSVGRLRIVEDRLRSFSSSVFMARSCLRPWRWRRARCQQDRSEHQWQLLAPPSHNI
ncbi:hypothetical protein O181_000558 [Austropuccinia psidii MF-1]|uniref:Uncharacterized protein n=1 Tax=Austropuccinia psidii MF-1 TaxID=1389203 RepID=A0A9Q3B924_9BASI|nr:hypothetical protein [Austropuccinia psidii MF-1]